MQVKIQRIVLIIIDIFYGKNRDLKFAFPSARLSWLSRLMERWSGTSYRIVKKPKQIVDFDSCIRKLYFKVIQYYTFTIKKRIKRIVLLHLKWLDSLFVFEYNTSKAMLLHLNCYKSLVRQTMCIRSQVANWESVVLQVERSVDQIPRRPRKKEKKKNLIYYFK